MKILVTPTSFNKPVNDTASKMRKAFADEVVYNELNRPLEAREVEQMLTGVDTNNIGEWIKAGAVAVGAGSSLTAGAKTGDYDAIVKVGR